MSNVKIIFKTFYKDKERKFSKPGTRFIPDYKMRFNKDTGARELVPEGNIDIYAQIQSYKDSTDINYILERFARGDVSALSKVQGTYGDFTQTPTTLAELQQAVIDAESYFYALPLNVREQFDFNPSKFYNSMGTDKFNKALGLDKVKESVDIAKETVLNNPVSDPVPGKENIVNE